MVPGGIQECATDAAPPRGGCHEQVVEDPDVPGGDRRKRRVELDETKAGARVRIDGQEHHRVVAGEAGAQERLGERVIRRLPVELAVGVEQLGHGAEVGQRGAADLERQRMPSGRVTRESPDVGRACRG